jgi:hypothetical protein
MKATYFLIQHSRGNHSAEQVYFHGKIIEQGTKKECQKELVRMRKFLKNRFAETSTNDTITDFVRYQMGDIFFIKKQNEIIEWA